MVVLRPRGASYISRAFLSINNSVRLGSNAETTALYTAIPSDFDGAVERARGGSWCLFDGLLGPAVSLWLSYWPRRDFLETFLRHFYALLAALLAALWPHFGRNSYIMYAYSVIRRGIELMNWV